MSKKNKPDARGFVFSTDPNFQFEEAQPSEATLPASQQKLRIRLETKHRGGKTVTMVTGFAGKEEDLEVLGKKVKAYCGTGGSVKDGAILVQGDHRAKILSWLLKNGYSQTK